MLNHKGVKTMKIFELSFCMPNLKNWLPKKCEVERPDKYNSNQFMAFQNSTLQFLKRVSSVIFSPRSSVFEAHFQKAWTLWKVKIAMGTLVQNL